MIKKVIDLEGWLNIGDIGWINFRNDLILIGCVKDIIVLINGENIEF